MSGPAAEPMRGPVATLPPPKLGDAARGKDVFRSETFGNEGFWTDAMRVPKGMADHKVTPIDALKTGLTVDADLIPADLKASLAKELGTDLAPANAPLLNDPQTTTKLVEAGAVVGIVPMGKDRVGISCALCHTISDGSVFEMPGGGSIGRRLDGRTPHTLNVGKVLSIAANSRAFFPHLQLRLGGKTAGRAPTGLTPDSTEDEVDAYLTNPKFFPVGTFDDTQDGNGNSVTIQPFFRQDLAAPFGSAGEHAVLDHFNNDVYTRLFDPTNLLSPDGRKFLHAQAGAAGDELADGYEKVLKATGVTGYPYVKASKTGSKPGEGRSPIGLRVDEQKLLDLNAYLVSLPAPKGATVDDAAFKRGREQFQADCARCHNADQAKPVPAALVDLKTLWPAYTPQVIARREPPLDAVQNSPGTFDDKMIVVDASGRGDKRGNALPLLLDLARKPVFLHDASVPSLDALLDPARGADAPHPFYVNDKSRRGDVVAFLRGLDTDHR
jgi:mono/diheme cytochrome c family protein